jgi:hypothetical protein
MSDQAPEGARLRSVFCACGAQWHGQWVKKAVATIVAHKERWGSGQVGCGYITHGRFRARFTCRCEACAVERAQKRLLKAQLRRGAGLTP